MVFIDLGFIIYKKFLTVLLLAVLAVCVLDIPASEGQVDEEWVRIWPSDAPDSTCWGSSGDPIPSTGEKSASWFYYGGGGCGGWKTFDVEQGAQIKLKASGDESSSCPGCVLGDINFYIYDYYNGQWNEERYVDGPDDYGGTKTYYYTPSGGKIKIDAESGFYIKAYQKNEGGGQYNLFTSASPSEGGSISFNPSGGPYEEGTEVTVTAEPAEGYEFDCWSGDASGTSISIDVTMNSDKNVKANFVKDIKADIVENYYQALHLTIEEINSEVEQYTDSLQGTAQEMLKPNPIEILGVSTEWADITDATATSFDILGSSTAQLSLVEMEGETSMGVRSEFSDDHGDFKGLVDSLKEWSDLLSNDRRSQAKTYAARDVNPRLLEATEFYHSRLSWANVEKFIKINNQIEELLPEDKNWFYDDDDSDGLPNYYEEEIGTNPQDNDTDDDGIKDSLDKTPTGSNRDLFSLRCPANLLVTDENGNRTGAVYEDGVFKETVNEIPGAGYSGLDSDHEFVFVNNPSSEDYKISVYGTGKGEYDLTIARISDEEVIKDNVTGVINSNETLNYKMSKIESGGVSLENTSSGGSEELPLTWMVVGIGVLVVIFIVTVYGKRGG